MILESMAQGKEPAAPQHIEDVLNLAPYLKPSVLSNLSSGLAKQGIDISSAVFLAEYLNDSSTVAMLENTRFEEVTPELLEKLMPFLNYDSKYTILQKILDGEMDWRLLRLVGLYMDDLVTLIEAAVVEGVLPWKVLKMLRGGEELCQKQIIQRDGCQT